VKLTATAQSDPQQSDAPASVGFLVAGEDVGSFGCDGVSTSCTGSVIWDSSGTVGQKAVEAVLTTIDSQTATDTIKVVVKSPTTLSFKPISGAAGKSVTVRGSALSSVDNSPAANLPVKVAVQPVLGRAHSVFLTTNANGAFSFTTTLASKAKLKATTPGNATFQSASATTTAEIRAVAQCSLAKKRVKSGGHDSLACKAPHLPDGATAALLDIAFGVWQDTGLHGKASNGKVRIGFTTSGHGKLKLRMGLFENRVYARGEGPVSVVVIT
jgi:hypothetical protein